MPLSKEKVSYLLQAWTSRKATEEEEKELFDWVIGTGGEDYIEDHIQHLMKQFTGREPMPAVDWENLYQQILQKRDSNKIQPKVRKMMPLLRRAAVAATIIFMLGGGRDFLFFINTVRENEIVKTN